MNDAFIICIGGSGIKVLESLIHMSSMPIYAETCMQCIHVLAIDTDTGNGNYARMKQSYTLYQKAYDRFKEVQSKGEFFKTEIILYEWQPVVANEDERNKLDGMLEGNREAGVLAKLLYSEIEMSHSCEEGFKGHPNIGVVLLQKMIEKLDKNNMRLGFNLFFDKVGTAENKDEKKRIFVVASCFGGTGATGIQIIQKYIRNHNNEIINGAELGTIIMLPYYTLNNKKRVVAMDPNSDTFNDKVKTVLHYYSNQSFWKNEDTNKTKKSKAYQQLYLIGYPNPNANNELTYSSGGNNQQNPSDFIEWYAVSAIHQFFSQKTVDENVNVSWLHNEPWDWGRFVENFPNLEICMTTMLQVASAILDEYMPAFRNIFRIGNNQGRKGVKERLKEYPIALAYFSNCIAADIGQWDLNGNEINAYFHAFVQWFIQTLRCTPVDYPAYKEYDMKKAIEARYAFHRAKKPREDKHNGSKMVHQIEPEVWQTFVCANVMRKIERKCSEYWPKTVDVIQPVGEGSINVRKTVIDMDDSAIEKKELGGCADCITALLTNKTFRLKNIIGIIQTQREIIPQDNANNAYAALVDVTINTIYSHHNKKAERAQK